jgi:hypothetical protein
MALFGKRKSAFPLSRNMLESREEADMVEDCMMTYGELTGDGIDSSSLPMPIRQVREASLFLNWVLNGGNGFEKYDMEEGWDAGRVAIALDGLAALGAGEIVLRLRPFADQISAVAHDPARRVGAFRSAWQTFAAEHLKSVEDMRLGLHFASRARSYLLDKVAFNVVSDANFPAALSSYRAGL